MARFITFILFCSLLSCRNDKQADKQIPTPEELKVPLLDANKTYVKQEADEIDQYIRQRNWNMISTGTGLKYMIYKQAEGEPAAAGNYARVNYKISLLNGTECYSSKKDGPKEFLIDQDHVESGLHEGIKYMKVGEKAILIIPSHLAHGLMGDENKIPPRSTVVFDIELLSLR
jgi:FKBP-type peptidyl-prolyl cis-trans isomerase